MNILSKRGSYIVEAAIIVPIFFLSLMALIGIIPIITTCENICFGVGEEVRMEMAKTAVRKNSSALPLAVRGRVYIETKKLFDFREDNYKYLIKEGDKKDLIKYGFEANFKQSNLIMPLNNIKVKGSITGRAFTGKYYEENSNEGGGTVYIFPKDGNCYHGAGCTYIKANCFQSFLTKETKRKYKPCPLCKAKQLPYGSSVFCFNYGKSYHKSDCKSIDKYFIEISKNQAIEKGYVCCSKCGGE